MNPSVSVLLTLLIFATPAAAQRLSSAVVPEHYTLWFAPDLDAAAFRDNETIRVQLRIPTAAITLHAVDIEFGDVTIESGGSTRPRASRSMPRPRQPRWRFLVRCRLAARRFA